MGRAKLGVPLLVQGKPLNGRSHISSRESGTGGNREHAQHILVNQQCESDPSGRFVILSGCSCTSKPQNISFTAAKCNPPR